MSIWEKMWAGGVLVVGILLLVLVILVIRSDGEVDYCWISAVSYSDVPKTYFSLYGHRPYRPDEKMGIFDSFEGGVEAAKTAQCPLTRR